MEPKGLPASKTSPPPPRTPAVVRPSETGFFARHGNTILTGLLLALAAALAVRWWTQSAAAARQAVQGQLIAARQSVDQLRGLQMASLPPEQLMAEARLVESGAKSAVSDVLIKADDGSTKGRALLVRGDLNWYLASLPEVPGAATQPALRTERPADQYLDDAAKAYGAVVAQPGADRQSVAAAKLGLAAIAEDRGDWAAAKQQLQAVAHDADPAVGFMAAAAKVQLASLPALQQPTYLLADGSTPPPAMTPMPSSRPTTGPVGLIGPVPLPSVIRDATTRPTTTPVPPPVTATRPAK